MQNQTQCDRESQGRDEIARRALLTPPISNEDILKRSKESQGKYRLRRSPTERGGL